MQPIIIDGSLGEGGGAMLRQSLGFSMLLQKPFVMKHIRANRPRPGLSMQHLTALNAAHQACSALVSGNSLGATEVSFTPGPLARTNLQLDIGTAGSISLLLQAFLLPAYFSGKNVRLTIKGGTDVAWSIPIDYLQKVVLPQLRKYGDASLKVLKRGFYPKGGGLVTFQVQGRYPMGAGAPSLTLREQGALFKVAGVSFASSDLAAARVAERQADAARIMLGDLKTPIDILPSYAATSSLGSGVVLWALCGDPKEGMHAVHPVILGSSALGDRQLRAEMVGEDAAKELIATIRADVPCDPHLADQLIPFLALCGGSLRTTELSDHLRSNIYVAEQFLPVKFVIDEEMKSVSCERPVF